MEPQQGIVSVVIGSRGFGFLLSENKKYFFHFSQFEPDKTPVVGANVMFDVLPAQETGKNPVAVNVRLVEGGAQ